MAEPNPDSVPRRAASLRVGDRVGGRFRVEAPLGAGGMASVWRVLDVSSGRQLALKLLSAGANERIRALFDREYHTLAGLEHARIVAVYDYGVHEGAPY